MRYEVFQHFTRDVWRLQRDVTCHGHSWPWVRVLRTESSICQPVFDIGEPRSYRGVARPPMSFQARSTTLERELGSVETVRRPFHRRPGFASPSTFPSRGFYLLRGLHLTFCDGPVSCHRRSSGSTRSRPVCQAIRGDKSLRKTPKASSKLIKYVVPTSTEVTICTLHTAAP
jgi:hypothetical protein